MKITPRLKLGLRGQTLLFVLLLVAIGATVAYLTRNHVWQADWTANHRNSLTPASQRLLTTLDGAVTITAFAQKNKQVRAAITHFIGQYQRLDPAIELTFVNPDTAPQRVRKLGITTNGELYIQYRGRSDTLKPPYDESALTNALLRLARTSHARVAFLSGHGERSPDGRANFDYGQFARALTAKGFRITTLNLANTPTIPDTTDLLVIASAQTRYRPGVVKQIKRYLAHGGNLLWMHDPGALHGLAPLATSLGVTFERGTIVDATSRLYGVTDVRWLVLSTYPPSPVTRHLDTNTLFPGAGAITVQPAGHWQQTPLIKSRSLPRSWLETGPLKGKIDYNKASGDKPGPLDIGIALQRPTPPPGTHNKTPHSRTNAAGSQRVIVIADGDFLSNTYLGNGGNLQLGLNIFNWLSGDEKFININVPDAPDKHLTLSPTAQVLLSLGFLFILPIGLLLWGGLMWRRRRKQ